VSQENRGGLVGVTVQGGFLEGAVLLGKVAPRVVGDGPSTGELAGRPEPIEGLDEHVVPAALEQDTVELPVGFCPFVGVVGAAGSVVQRRAGETVMRGADAGLPGQIATFDGESQCAGLDELTGLGDLLPSSCREGWDLKAAVGQTYREAFADQAQERLSGYREADPALSGDLLWLEGLVRDIVAA